MKKIFVLLFLALACCAQVVQLGNGTSSGSYTVPISNSLASIVISGPATIDVPSTGSFTALGTLSNGSTTDLTASAVWVSSNLTIATISGSGNPRIATCVKGGNFTLTATSAGVVGSVSLPCNKLLTGATISPSSTSAFNGNGVTFTANCTYNDGTSGDCTTQAAWSSSNSAVATIADLGATPQPATCVSTGTITATALIGAFSPTASLVCSPSGGGLVITTGSLPNAVRNSLYSQTVTASGGTPPYTWSLASGSLPTGLGPIGSGTGTIAGTPTVLGTSLFTVRVTDSVLATVTASLSIAVNTTGLDAYCGSGNVAAFGSSDGPAALPVSCYFTNPSATLSPLGTQGLGPYSDETSLQTALNNANCGQIIEVTAGVTIPVNPPLVLPSKVCDAAHTILVQVNGAAANLPPYGTRISPCQFGVISRPGYPNFNCGATNNVGATLQSTGSDGTSGGIVMSVTAPASSWRFRGIRFTRANGTGFISRLIDFPAVIGVDHFIFDQDWFDGSLNPADDTNRAMNISYVSYIAVIDSDGTEFHCKAGGTGNCTDAQVIIDGLNTSGTAVAVRKIVNNFCTASGEGCMISGGGGANTTPTDLEFRLNYAFGPLTWNPGCTVPTCGVAFQGTFSYQEKNLFELKNFNRALIENNVFQHSWIGADQVANCMLLTPKNQFNNLAPLAFDANITVRFNHGTDCNYAIQIANIPASGGGYASGGHNYSIHDNVFDDLGDPNTCTGCSTSNASGIDGGFYSGVDGTIPAGSQGHDVSLIHNDFIPTPGASMKAGTIGLSGPKAGSGAQMSNYNWENNLTLFQTGGGATGIANPVGNCGLGFNANCTPNNTPASAQLNALFGATFDVSGNALVNDTLSGPNAWPGTNCTAETTLANIFVNYNNGVMLPNGDFHIKPTSPCHNAANDGTDPGANISALLAGISGVDTWVAFNPPPPSWVLINTPAASTKTSGFAIDSANNWFVSDRVNGIYKSINQGTSWTACADTGLTDTGTYNLQWDPKHSQLIISTRHQPGTLANNIKFWRSPDCGTWTQITQPALMTESQSATQTTGAAITPGGRIYYGGFPCPANCSGSWYSDDGGITTLAATDPVPGGTTCPTAGSIACPSGLLSMYYNPVTGNCWKGEEQWGVFVSVGCTSAFVEGSPPDKAIDSTNGLSNGIGAGTNSDPYGLTSDLFGNMYQGAQGGIWKSSGACTHWSENAIGGTISTDCAWSLVFVNGNTSQTRLMWTDPAGNVYFSHKIDSVRPAPVYRLAASDVAACTNTANCNWQPFSVGLTNNWEGFSMLQSPFDGHLYLVLELGSTNQGQVWKF